MRDTPVSVRTNMPDTKPPTIESTVVDEIDRLRYALSGEKTKRLQAEMQALRLQLNQLSQDLAASLAEHNRLSKEMSNKYGLREGDSFSVSTGKIARE